MSLLKMVGGKALEQASKILAGRIRAAVPKLGKLSMSTKEIEPEEQTCKYECFFQRNDIDGWDIRQAMNDMMGYDSVPDPTVIIAALQACRRVNDYALTVRFIEAVKDKCGSRVKEFYPYIVQEIAPTMYELGCDIPETLCYHKPELWLENPNEIS